MQLLIDIPEKRYKDILRIADVQLENRHFKTAEQIIANGTPLPKGEWEDVPMGYYMLLFRCSNCLRKSTMKSKYCPNCGTKMEVGDE